MVASRAVRKALLLPLLMASIAAAPAPKSEDLPSRAMRLHRSAIVVDTHEDVPEQLEKEWVGRDRGAPTARTLRGRSARRAGRELPAVLGKSRRRPGPGSPPFRAAAVFETVARCRSDMIRRR